MTRPARIPRTAPVKAKQPDPRRHAQHLALLRQIKGDQT